MYVSIIGQAKEEIFSLLMVFYLTVVRKFRSRISFGAVQNQPAQTADWRNRFGLWCTTDDAECPSRLVLLLLISLAPAEGRDKN